MEGTKPAVVTNEETLDLEAGLSPAAAPAGSQSDPDPNLDEEDYDGSGSLLSLSSTEPPSAAVSARREKAKQRKILIVKVFYYLIFTALAALMPFLPVFFKSKGYSKTQIGALQAFQPLIGFVGGALGPALADKTQSHRWVLLVSLVATLIFRSSLYVMDGFALTAFMVVLGNLLGSPSFPLIDSSAVDLLGKNSQDYGKLRMWGTIGWGVSAPLVGFLVTQTTLATSFLIHGVVMLPVLLLCFSFPVRKTSKSAAAVAASATSSTQVPVPADREGEGQGMSSILKSPEVWCFFMTVFFVGHAAGSITTTLFVFLKGLGASELLMGICLTLNCVAEVPAFFYFNKILDKLGVRGVLYLSFFMVTARIVYYAFLTVPWLVFPAELLGGASYAITWSACTFHGRALAPKGMGATMQGLLKGVNGIGVGVGSLVAGAVYDHFNDQQTYLILATIPMIGLIAFFISNHLLDARRPSEHPLGPASSTHH